MDRVDELLSQDTVKVRTGNDARELLGANFDTSPYELIEQLRKIGHRKARAEGRAYQLEQERPIILARISTELSRAHAGEHLSEARLERMARADSRYTTHISGTAVALEERQHARSEYEAVKSLLEWDRASVAHLNALSRLEDPT